MGVAAHEHGVPKDLPRDKTDVPEFFTTGCTRGYYLMLFQGFQPLKTNSQTRLLKG
jgi:hypothetical protein